jgi:hypothetical protein
MSKALTAGTVPMSGAQRGAIYGLAKRAGLDRDALHDVVWRVTARDSIANLTVGEAIRVIDRLKTLAGQEPGGQANGRPGWMTDAQKGKICALCRELHWVDEAGDIDQARLDGFVRVRFGIAAQQWVDARAAGIIINALKAMVRGGRESGNAMNKADLTITTPEARWVWPHWPPRRMGWARRTAARLLLGVVIRNREPGRRRPSG